MLIYYSERQQPNYKHLGDKKQSKMIKCCTNDLHPGNEMLPKLIKFGNIDYTFINKSVVNCLHLMYYWKPRGN